MMKNMQVRCVPRFIQCFLSYIRCIYKVLLCIYINSHVGDI